MELTEAGFASGSLERTSYALPGKLFTANQALVERTVGALSADAMHALTEAVIRLLRGT